MTTVAISISSRGRAETERLTRALLDLGARGLRTHCSDPSLSELWLSDHEPERREAARLCAGCPVLVECRTAADARDERWHVWGGKDYTRRPRTNKQPDRKENATRRELRWAPS